MSGYYPATYGFEDIQEGYLYNGWEDKSKGGSAKVISGYKGHNKVLKLYDPLEWWFPSKYAKAETNFENQKFGTIEFWFSSTDTGQTNYLILRDGSIDRIKLYVAGDQWKFRQTFTDVVPGLEDSTDPVNNKWYHVQIHFETRANGYYQGLKQYQWKLRVGDDESKPMPFTNNGEINKLVFATHGWCNYYSMYIDAVGLSWDPYYSMYNNKYEGIYVDFSPAGLDSMYCNYDGVFRPILGRFVLPMPKSGSHSIRISGFDEYDLLPYISDVRTFTINFAEKIGVVMYSSDCNAGSSGNPTNSENNEYFIDKYVSILRGEGYQKIYIYRDVGTEDEFNTIMDCFAEERIDQSDEFFFYLWCHGSYYYRGSNIGSCSKPSTYGPFYLYDDHLDEKMEYIYQQSQSSKIGFVLETCYSGGYLDYFQNDYPFLAISATADNVPSKGNPLLFFMWFSEAFWNEVYFGKNAVQAFNIAKQNWWVKTYGYNQNPQIADNSPSNFVFFG